MNRKLEHSNSYNRRLRLSTRQIVVAFALTLAAAAFVMATKFAPQQRPQQVLAPPAGQPAR